MTARSWRNWVSVLAVMSIAPLVLVAAGTPAEATASGPPTTVTAPASLFTTADTVAVAWSAKPYNDNPIASYDVRARWAAYDSGLLTTWTQPAAWQSTTETSASVPIDPGSEMCLEVRATDTAGDVGAWSKQRCVARFLDDRVLSDSPNWHLASDDADYDGTITATIVHGSVLTLDDGQGMQSAQINRVGLLVTACYQCGTVTVRVGGKKVAVRTLYAGSSRHQYVEVLPRVVVPSGPVTVTVKSRNKPVLIDGIAVRHSAA